MARGLTTARQGALDGTLIAAQASRHRLVNLTRLQRRLADWDRVLAAERSGRDPGAIPAWMARTPATRRRQRHRFAEARRQLLRQHALNARRTRDQRQEPEKIVLSTSEVEAALGRDEEKVFRPLDHVQVVQDLESLLVLGSEVFAQTTDAGTLLPLRQRAWVLTGVWLERMLADATYASALDLVDCAAAGVDLYAPSQENDRSEARRARRPPRQLPKDRFVWRAEEQVSICPQGHRLERVGVERRARGEDRSIELTTDRCAKEHCRACPLVRQCTTSAQGRTIKRSEHEKVIVAHQAKMQRAESKALYKRRGQTIELRFADAKAHRGLRRFSGRGLTRVRIEVGLWVLSHNLQVVLRTGRRKTTESPDERPCRDAA